MKKRFLQVGLLSMSIALAVSCRNEPEQANPMDSGVEVDENPKTANLNPEHGKPGHRCDIPVGAPLDGSLSLDKILNADRNQSQTPSSTTSPVELDQRPKNNPPHGQPYHDCALPVGAPFQG